MGVPQRRGKSYLLTESPDVFPVTEVLYLKTEHRFAGNQLTFSGEQTSVNTNNRKCWAPGSATGCCSLQALLSQTIEPVKLAVRDLVIQQR